MTQPKVDPALLEQMEAMYGIIKLDPRWGGQYCIGVCQELKEAAFADVTELVLCGDTLPVLVSDEIVNVTDGQGNKHSDLWICRLPEPEQ